jgi:hypothetical protein
MVPVAMAQTPSRSCKWTSTVIGPRPRLSWPTRCGWGSRVRPLPCTRLSVPTPLQPPTLAQAQPFDGHPHPLSNRHAAQTGQRSHPAPSAPFLPRQSPLAPGHHLAACGPDTGGQHGIMGRPSWSDKTACTPVISSQDALTSAEGACFWLSVGPYGERCVR